MRCLDVRSNIDRSLDDESDDEDDEAPVQKKKKSKCFPLRFIRVV